MPKGPTATLTITGTEAAALVALVQQRPGVTRHRMALAVIDVGLKVLEEHPERLEAALAASSERAATKRKAKT